MTLKEFREHIESFPLNTEFKNGISAPFSWRGSYNEVAFTLFLDIATREEILDKISMAYEGLFSGWKGGEYRCGDNTPIHFEAGSGYYSDGQYSKNLIDYFTIRNYGGNTDRRLVKLAFKTT